MKNPLLAVSIRKSFISIIILGLGFSWSLAAQEDNPHFIYISISVISLFGLSIFLIASLIIGFVSWRKTSRWWIAPFLASAAFMLSAPLDLRIGIAIADWKFRTHLQEYVRTVDDIRSGLVPCNATFGPISPNVSPLNVKKVLAAHYPDGATVVLFLVGSGFPLHHTGYLFNGSGENITCIAQFKSLENKYYLRHVTGNWYHFSG